MPPLSSLKDVPLKIIASHREVFEFDIDRTGPCWIWTKTKNWDGYGQTSIEGKSISAHRLSYMLNKGDIPSGMVVRHCCPGGGNRACVNPDHLILGSKADNNRDTVSIGKGGKGGPRRESKDSLRIDTASLVSDRLIHLMSNRTRLSLPVIARRLGLPLEHVVFVTNATIDSEGWRNASRFEMRFWSKVRKSDGCWLWLAMTIAGYGRIRADGKIVGSHQMSWKLHRGIIPKGSVVCHNCPNGDNPRCVNPQHLFVGSQIENLRDRSRKQRQKLPGAHGVTGTW